MAKKQKPRTYELFGGPHDGCVFKSTVRPPTIYTKRQPDDDKEPIDWAPHKSPVFTARYVIGEGDSYTFEGFA